MDFILKKTYLFLIHFTILLLSNFFIFCAIEIFFSYIYLNLNTSQNDFRPYSSSHNLLAESVNYNLYENPILQFDSQLLYSLRHNQNSLPLAKYEGINPDGHRGTTYDSKANYSKKVILALGDSCTFGWWIYKFEHTWTYGLEKLLNYDFPNSYRVINYGQPGHSTEQGKIVFKNIFEKIKPRIVILYYGWNDLWTTPSLTDRQLIGLTKIYESKIMKFIAETYTYKTLSVLLRSFTRKYLTPSRNLGANQAKRRVPIGQTLSNFRWMVNEALRHNTKVILILPPYSQNKHKELAQMKTLHDMLVESFNKITIIPELERLSNMDNNSFFFGDGYHLNIAGANYLAYELFKTIKNYHHE